MLCSHLCLEGIHLAETGRDGFSGSTDMPGNQLRNLEVVEGDVGAGLEKVVGC